MKIEFSAEFTMMYYADKCAELGIDVAALKNAGYVAIED